MKNEQYRLYGIHLVNQIPGPVKNQNRKKVYGWTTLLMILEFDISFYRDQIGPMHNPILSSTNSVDG